MKATPRPRRISLIALSLAGVLCGMFSGMLSAQEMRQAPAMDAAPVNQLSIAGNACGPAALLAAFRCGDPNWRRVADTVTGENDRERLGKIIREVAMRPSKNLPGRPRWSRSGVNIADLCDMANEMGMGLYLPRLQYEVLFLKPKESQQELLQRVHGRLEKSLAKGLPPLLSIKRYVNRKGWQVLDGHFVTVIAVPKKLEKGARAFPVTYLDPWGGKRCQGTIAISDQGFLSGKSGGGDPLLSPCLEAVFPQASVGKSRVAKGEPTVLTVSAGMGRW